MLTTASRLESALDPTDLASEEAQMLLWHRCEAFHIPSLHSVQLVSFISQCILVSAFTALYEEGSMAQERLRTLSERTGLKNKLIIRAE